MSARRKPSRARANGIRTAAYGALGIAAILLIVLILSSSGSSAYTIRAEFKDVDGLIKGSTIKENGLAVGTIKSLTVTKNGTHALATLSIEKAAAPIGEGAQLSVRPTDLLGERYVQLTPGDYKNHPLKSGAFVPESRTMTPVDLDTVLNSLNAPVRMRLQILINEAGIALAGRGADFNKLLGQLPPNLGQARQLLAQVSGQNAALKSMISQGSDITKAVNARRSDMGHAITVAESALSTVASRQQQLSQTFANAPSALSQLRTTLSQIGSASQAILPAAADLQRTAPPLTATLQALPSFAKAANPTLVTAQRVAPEITRLGNQAQQPLARLRPTARKVQTIFHQGAPILTELNTRGVHDILWFVQNWALAMHDRDGIGHWVHASLQIDPSIVIATANSYIKDTGIGQTLQQAKARGDRAAALRSAGKKVPKSLLPTTGPAAGSPASGGGANNPLSGVLGGIGKNPTVSGALGGLQSLLHSTAGKTASALGGVAGALAKTVGSGSGGNTPGNVKHLLSYLLGK